MTSANPGLMRRFQNSLSFPDWSAGDCVDFVLKRAARDSIAVGGTCLTVSGLFPIHGPALVPRGTQEDICSDGDTDDAALEEVLGTADGELVVDTDAESEARESASGDSDDVFDAKVPFTKACATVDEAATCDTGRDRGAKRREDDTKCIWQDDYFVVRDQREASVDLKTNVVVARMRREWMRPLPGGTVCGRRRHRRLRRCCL